MEEGDVTVIYSGISTAATETVRIVTGFKTVRFLVDKSKEI